MILSYLILCCDVWLWWFVRSITWLHAADKEPQSSDRVVSVLSAGEYHAAGTVRQHGDGGNHQSLAGLSEWTAGQQCGYWQWRLASVSRAQSHQVSWQLRLRRHSAPNTSNSRHLLSLCVCSPVLHRVGLLMVGLREGCPACKTLCHLIPKVLFCISKLEMELSDPSLPGRWPLTRVWWWWWLVEWLVVNWSQVVGPVTITALWLSIFLCHSCRQICLCDANISHSCRHN